MLEVFIRENCYLASRLYARFKWNLLKWFIKKKFANELPNRYSIQMQCVLQEDAKTIIIFLVRKFDTSPRFSFEGETCPYKPCIRL